MRKNEPSQLVCGTKMNQPKPKSDQSFTSNRARVLRELGFAIDETTRDELRPNNESSQSAALFSLFSVFCFLLDEHNVQGCYCDDVTIDVRHVT